MSLLLALVAPALACVNDLDLSLAWTLSGGPNELAGLGVRVAGDVNNDGVDDFLTLALDINGTTIVQARSGLDRSLLHSFTQATWAVTGVPFDGVGDVNGDGFDDVAVGDSSQNVVRVFSGQTGGVLHTLSGLGLTADEEFGRSLAGVGDVDGDGVGDLAVAALPLSVGEYVQVFSGSSGNPLYDLTGSWTLGFFGTSIAGVGDVDGDGLDDFVVGAPSDGTLVLNPGSPPFVPPFQHIDGAGRVYVISGATGSVLWSMAGDEAEGGLGFSVAAAGDLNGDGIGDVVAGSASFEFPNQGYARAFSGADGQELFTMLREFQDSRTFVSVDGGRDLDGDGIADVVLSAVAGGPFQTPDLVIYSGATGQLAGSLSVISSHPLTQGNTGVAVGGNGLPDLLVASRSNAFGLGFTFGYEVGLLGTSYCSAAGNSTGFEARIRATGSTSVAANELCLVASPVPDGFGLFAYGALAQQVPLGNGFLCIGGTFARLPAEAIVGHTLRHTVDLSAPASPALAIQPGSTWHFQAWYRDVAAGGAQFNLSDGLELSFQP